ncbi:hypothetical protein [Paraglaciecola sp. L3A3]|uniref:hypothetical protein n=1 Tax=Paraglaciecola sp. L3A3 TaxID=2686358 RepID=UPI00131CD58E|nr:hypothetical protein [Paraglaciecola sp. L3A3]
MQILRILLSCLIIFGAGCATNELVAESELEHRLSLWLGLPATRLYAQIGKPYETANDASGKTVLMYFKETLSSDNRLWHCRVTFTLNDKQKIISSKLVNRNENAWDRSMPCVHIIQVPV